MAFLIIDPYLFIYPYGEEEPLHWKKALQFVQNLSDWATRLKQNEHEFGISNDCVNLLKSHPRSILNGKFLQEVAQVVGTAFSQINQVLVDLLSTLKNKLAFAAAMQPIRSSASDYKIELTTIAPSEFATRLPEGFDTPFLQMLGDLTFARAQRLFPIAAFEQVQFVTAMTATVDWLSCDQRLLTSVHVKLGRAPTWELDPLTNPLMDEFEIVCDASSLTETQPFKPLRTLRDAIDATIDRCGGAVVMSRELERKLKKDNDVCTNPDEINSVIYALGMIWLPEYSLRRREQHTHNNAIQYATEKFRKAISHNISNESESVRNNPRLRNQRLVKYAEMELYAFLHVKISPRIYFDVVNYGGQDIIVLGPIGHLDTARHGANSTA